MGHAEMSLAVAGLNELQIDEKKRMLASGDWSSLPPDQRGVLHYARKLSKQPRSIDDADVQTLIRHFGSDRSIDWIYHVCWANFMTRFADAFQLPLEATNVFMPPDRAKQKPGDVAAKTPEAPATQPKPSAEPRTATAPATSTGRGTRDTRRLPWRRANADRSFVPRRVGGR